jgi:hypothetical protein
MLPGEARADSDVDFLVIEPVVANRLQEWERLRRALTCATVRSLPTPEQIEVAELLANLADRASGLDEPAPRTRE